MTGVRAQVVESRRAQGLPATVDDAVLLGQLAAALLAAALLAETPATEGGGGRAPAA